MYFAVLYFVADAHATIYLWTFTCNNVTECLDMGRVRWVSIFRYALWNKEHMYKHSNHRSLKMTLRTNESLT